MLLAIDVGNTNSVFSVSKEKEILSEWRCSTDGKYDRRSVLYMVAAIIQYL